MQLCLSVMMFHLFKLLSCKYPIIFGGEKVTFNHFRVNLLLSQVPQPSMKNNTSSIMFPDKFMQFTVNIIITNYNLHLLVVTQSVILHDITYINCHQTEIFKNNTRRFK